MAVWTADIPGRGTSAYALLVDASPYEGASLMPSVAGALGIDPGRGVLTRAIREDTRFRFEDRGQVSLVMPGNVSMENPAPWQWQYVSRCNRYVHLNVSYLRFPAGAVVEEQQREMARTEDFSSGLVTVV